MNGFTISAACGGSSSFAKTVRWAFSLCVVAGAIAQPQYTISTYAGGVPPAGTAPSVASVGGVTGVAVDGAGNFYFSSQLHCVFKVTGGSLARVAGTCRPGYSGDGSAATSAQLNGPTGLALDGAGNLYIADSANNRVRKVATNGTISTVVGSGTAGYGGDGGQATSAQLKNPQGVAVDLAGNLYISDTSNNTIRRASTTGVITTIAGTTVAGSGGDGGAAVAAQLNFPAGLALDGAGNIYVADQGNSRVRKISGGTISTVAGSGIQGYSGDGASATAARLSGPTGVSVDSSNNLYIADLFNSVVRRVSGGTITTFAGMGVASFGGDGGAAASAQLNSPRAVAVDGTANVYIADSGNNRVRLVASGVINTAAGDGTGGYSGDGGQATSAQLALVSSAALDSAGNLYVADTANHRIRKITPGGTITTVAGTGAAGYSGDSAQATSAMLNAPAAVAVTALGDLLIADTGNHRVRRVSNGVISTVAGTGVGGYSGDGALATSAQLNSPGGVAADMNGNIYISDTLNQRVREVAGGTITTIAGTGVAGYSGDGSQATSARVNFPTGLAFDTAGNLYIADRFNNVIRKVSSGLMSTVAGNGTAGYSGDGGAATSALLNSPGAVAVDAASNLYIADTSNNRTRYVSSGGTISTIAGSGAAGYSGDGGAATAAQLDSPMGVAVDGAGKVFIAEPAGNDVRVLISSGNNAPSVVSGSPSVSTTSPQIFTFTGSDSDGAADINNFYFLINSNPAIPQNTCHGFYNRAQNALYLYNDALTAALGPLTPGSSGTLQNSQCIVYGSSSSLVPASGTNLVLNIGLGLQGPYAGTNKNVYLWVKDNEGHDTGWVQTSTWNLAAAAHPPNVVSGTPTSSTTSPQTFTFTGQDADGATDIGVMYFLVNSSASIPQNSCHGFYVRAQNALYLYNDALTAAQGPLTPGTAGTLQNSQCVVYGSSSSLVSASGTNLVVNIGLGLQGSYAGTNKNVYLWVKDNEGHDTGWVQTSTWNLAAAAANPPSVVSGAPTISTTSPQTFTFTGQDPDGATDIGVLYFLVNSSASVPQNSCHGLYVRAQNALYLYNDALTAVQGPLTPGTSGTLQNSQCIVYGSSSSLVSASGTNLVVSIGLGLQGSYAGTNKNVYVWVKDNEGHDTGWIQTSTWNLAAAATNPPSVLSGTPTTSTTSPQTFTFTGQDMDGATDIGVMYFLVNSSAAIPQNTCHGLYVRAQNALYLYNDALTAVQGPLTPGTAGTLQNSQCVVYGSSSSLVSASGTNLVVNIGLGLQGSYAGTNKNVYLWVKDNEGHDTGWIQTSRWSLAAAATNPPSVVSGTPTTSSTSPQTFTFTGQDADGVADIGVMYFLVNSSASVPQNTCHGFYVRAQNALYLYNDALTAAQGPLTPGTSGTLQNSQCVVYGSSSSLVSASGTNLVVNIGLGLQGSYAGTQKNVYLWVKDNEGHDTGWIQTGIWQ